MQNMRSNKMSSRGMSRMFDVVIVGAGPAGLSAAISCRKHDLDVLVVDEFPKSGGRLLGQLHQEPTGEWWNGVKETEKLLDEATALNVTIKNGVSVYHIEKTDDHFIVHTEEHTSELQSRGHLVCRLLLEKKKISHQTRSRNNVRNSLV